MCLQQAAACLLLFVSYRLPICLPRQAGQRPRLAPNESTMTENKQVLQVCTKGQQGTVLKADVCGAHYYKSSVVTYQH